MVTSPQGTRGRRFACAFAPSTTAGQIRVFTSKHISVNTPRLRAATIAQMRIDDVVKPFATAASAFGSAAVEKATSMWNTITNEPTPEEVEANLAAFAKAHRGAVMAPLSEDELESEVKFCALIPELRDALMDAEVMQDELEEAALQKELAAKERL
eukprot:CAMPEP_0181298426 /NCGR_PEP_ID=MMETSP1101-20121128/5775_1 /TAXON_ID=46948 /ORGANISM="Rhodomonas abbreviata, Strain Caron Lab Isolate" /LENGTH=155 /DNA_ID=CAMNT_0023403445 /DNA_START=188 /DNA_END=655 /DNA_ORIENTATION=-